MRLKSVLLALSLAVPVAATAQPPQPPAGDAVFARACASCHQAGQTAVPPPDALRAYTPEAIVNALTNGKMAVQGATLTTAERVAVAQFLTGRTFAASARRSNQCTAATPTTDPLQGPSIGQIQVTARTSVLPDTSAWIDAMNAVPGFADAWTSSIAITEDESGIYYNVTATVQVTDAAYSHRFDVTDGEG